jgi:hypothetical protein
MMMLMSRGEILVDGKQQKDEKNEIKKKYRKIY